MTLRERQARTDGVRGEYRQIAKQSPNVLIKICKEYQNDRYQGLIGRKNCAQNGKNEKHTSVRTFLGSVVTGLLDQKRSIDQRIHLLTHSLTSQRSGGQTSQRNARG